jgi:hypothetical protein
MSTRLFDRSHAHRCGGFLARSIPVQKLCKADQQFEKADKNFGTSESQVKKG